MRAAGSWEKVDALGLGGDGTHLSSSLYAAWASVILDEIARRAAPFSPRAKGIFPQSPVFSTIELNGNENWGNPASTGQSAGSLRADSSNFFVELRTNRGLAVQTSDGSTTLMRAVSFEGNSYSILMSRAYVANMSGALPATYTAPTTGGVIYVEGNELKWRNAATGVVTTVSGQVAVPATASSTGTAGQWAADASHYYRCIATNTWVRAALSTW